ncbi:MAG TPA: cytochrome c [Sphingomonadaceae bacterium]|nr:cytochrome c [Sphingomonadaceae bacterium]
MKSASGVAALFGTAAIVFAAASGNAQDAPGGVSSVDISSEGKEVYEQICQACHLADAKGGGGAGAIIPALAGNAKLGDADFTIGTVVKGRGGMPWFNDLLTPAQIAAVVNYVRTHFNDFPGQVTEAQVAAVVAANGSPAAECATC